MPLPDHHLSIDGFLEDLKDWFDRKERIVVFLGSGASESSGIPLGSELARLWLKEIHHRKRASDDEPIEHTIERLCSDVPELKELTKENVAEFYPYIYAERFKDHPADGATFIRELIEGKHPCVGYIMLAYLLSEQHISDVITANFDHLVEEALLRFTPSFPRVIGHEGLSEHALQIIGKVPTIIKVHRDAYLTPANISEEIEKLKTHWKTVLPQFLRDVTLVVIGYGGNDMGFIDVLPDCKPNRLYWMTYDEELIRDKVRDVALKLNGQFVKTDGFDSLMFKFIKVAGLTEKQIEGKALDRLDELKNRVKGEFKRYAAIEAAKFVAVLKDDHIQLQAPDSSPLLTALAAISDDPVIDMASAPSHEEALRIFKGTLKNDVLGYNILINKAPDYETAKGYFDDMLVADLKPDVFTYTTLINKSPDYETAKGHFDDMPTADVEPNVVTYTTLINKSPDYETAKGYFDEMLAVGLKPNEITYNTLINKSPDYETAKGGFDDMLAAGLKPGEVTYNTLINKSPDYETAKAYFDEMLAAGLKPNEVTYNTLIHRSPHETAKAYFNEMLATGLKPNEVTYSTLINRSPDYETAKGYFDEMLAAGLKPNEVTYNTLINKSPDYETAKAYFDEMLAAGLKPNEVTYNTLINKSPDYETAKAYFDEMLAAGLKPNGFIYNTLIHKSDHETAKAYFDEMLAAGLKPNEVTYSTLINKSPDYATAKGYFDAMMAADLELSAVALTSLLATVRSVPEFILFLGILGRGPLTHAVLAKKLRDITKDRSYGLLLGLCKANPARVHALLELFAAGDIVRLLQEEAALLKSSNESLHKHILAAISVDTERKYRTQVFTLIQNHLQPWVDKVAMANAHLQYCEFAEGANAFMALAGLHDVVNFRVLHLIRAADCYVSNGQLPAGKEALRLAYAEAVDQKQKREAFALLVLCALLLNQEQSVQDVVAQVKKDIGRSVNKQTLVGVAGRLLRMGMPDRGAQVRKFIDPRFPRTKPTEGGAT